jgi:hypothetical protein
MSAGAVLFSTIHRLAHAAGRRDPPGGRDCRCAPRGGRGAARSSGIAAGARMNLLAAAMLVASAFASGLLAAPALAPPGPDGIDWATVGAPNNPAYYGPDPFGYVTISGSTASERTVDVMHDGTFRAFPTDPATRFEFPTARTSADWRRGGGSPGAPASRARARATTTTTETWTRRTCRCGSRSCRAGSARSSDRGVGVAGGYTRSRHAASEA